MHHCDDYISLLVSCFDISVRVGSLFQQIAFIDNRFDLSCLNLRETNSSVVLLAAPNITFLLLILEVHSPRTICDGPALDKR